jgi:hypothetical protein
MNSKCAKRCRYTALQLGMCDAKVKNVAKPIRVHCEKAGVHPKRKLGEFRVNPEAILPIGHLGGGGGMTVWAMRTGDDLVGKYGTVRASRLST